ncbi:hypothetical protein JOQ06_010970 [Pogonophryne albipinna]|uniref:Uncharacterized protein n=1 Tax=Pogonophryne albipinna TaxID=1090488 RepID=A0AAD6AV10_9TELE|nr:hypothetical protein JOQ06_010970 [Pogonophryne albipinna]
MEVRGRVKSGGSTGMKTQQCLERGQRTDTLIYNQLIGNSRVLHLNRILGGGEMGWRTHRSKEPQNKSEARGLKDKSSLGTSVRGGGGGAQ